MRKKRHKEASSKPKSSLKSAFAGFLLFVVFFSVATLMLSGNYKSPCANSISCISDLSGSYIQDATGIFMGQKVRTPPLAKELPSRPVLGTKTESNKHIYINLTTQTIQAFEGNTLMYEFPVSTGKWNHTPTGDYRIWIKLRYTRMSGGNRTYGTYYNLPNVPYTMYFYNKEHPKNEGYGIHGAYWHNNFGHPMSHGCVNMDEEDVAVLYKWAHPEHEGYVTYASADNPGTPITIYGETPAE